MNTLSKILMCGTIALSASSVFAMDAMKPSMQDCKDHMAMAKKDGMKKDDASMKMDKTCSAMMKADHGKMGDGMKKDGMKKEGMMK